tara:strand:+ start:1048 stop:1371 length:324 start_codon:yes stop_codon:yes gene_type:complete
MAIFTDHESVAQFTLGLVIISLIFLGYLLFRIREIGADVDCMHQGFHELIVDAHENQELELIDQLELSDYVLEFSDHLGLPTYKHKIPKEEDNTSSEVSDWDSGTTE